MTDEERRNRNPKPEMHVLKLEECPPIAVADLEPHRVYILLTPLSASSWNYMGKEHTLDPVSLDVIVVHVFHAPRIRHTVALKQHPLGGLCDATGHRIELRAYNGPDA